MNVSDILQCLNKDNAQKCNFSFHSESVMAIQTEHNGPLFQQHTFA